MFCLCHWIVWFPKQESYISTCCSILQDLLMIYFSLNIYILSSAVDEWRGNLIKNQSVAPRSNTLAVPMLPHQRCHNQSHCHHQSPLLSDEEFTSTSFILTLFNISTWKRKDSPLELQEEVQYERVSVFILRRKISVWTCPKKSDALEDQQIFVSSYHEKDGGLHWVKTMMKHWSSTHTSSLLWLKEWIFKPATRPNVLPHPLHTNDLLPKWITSMCCARLVFDV